MIDLVSKLSITGTGSHDNNEYRTVVCNLDKFEVTVKLDQFNKFISIEEIKINRDFLDYKQKSSISVLDDIEKYYID